MNGLNVLLTGACGRIGKTFFEASKDRYTFVLTDRVEPDFPVEAPHRFVRLDMAAPKATEEALEGIDVIVTCRHSPRQRNLR